MSRSLRLLCTGDLHVGRRPSRVTQFVDGRRTSCAAMMDAIVELAIQEKVDAVLISGDIVDRENRFYEAYGPVERGLRALARHGIDVFAVSGNHDFDVLPRLVDDVGPERFHLIGRGGNWERVSLRREGTEVLHLVGWSFPAEHVADNPMRSFRPLSNGHIDGVATLGLLHADLDQPLSRYAPVALADLHAVPVAMWLLGHVHKPRHVVHEGRAGVLYPGSPQAMDPGETGAHGPWIVEIDPGGRTRAKLVPLSRVRYDEIEIDLTGIDTAEAFASHVPRALKNKLDPLCAECGPMEFCCCRIRFVGRTRLHRRLKEHCDAIQNDLELTIGPFIARIDHVIFDTRPAIDLDVLARRNDVPGELARLVLTLQTDASAGPAQALIARTIESSADICGARPFQSLRGDQHPAPDAACARGALLRQGWMLLDALLAQKEPA